MFDECETFDRVIYCFITYDNNNNNNKVIHHFLKDVLNQECLYHSPI